jgi:phage gp36-like protein
MAYSTIEDIKAVMSEADIAQLTDDAGGMAIDGAKVARAIEDADIVIDSFLRFQYTVPLSSVPPLVRKLSADISVFNLFSRRRALADEIPESVMMRYRDAMKMLERIQGGRVSLGIEPETSTSQPAIRTSKKDNDRVFTRRLLEGY